MICHKAKTIFIHIPKTGGESVSSLFPDQDKTIPKHANAQQIYDHFGRDVWNSYYKLSVVRSPWDMVVSMYSHLRKPLYQKDNIVRKYGKIILNPVNAAQVALISSFSKYVYEVFYQKQEQEEALKPLWPVKHFSPAVDWLSINGSMSNFDLIIKFDELSDKIKLIEGHLGREIDLYQKNGSIHSHYSNYYSCRSRNIISQHYKKDINAFCFEFIDQRNLRTKLMLNLGLK